MLFRIYQYFLLINRFCSNTRASRTTVGPGLNPSIIEKSCYFYYFKKYIQQNLLYLPSIKRYLEVQLSHDTDPTGKITPKCSQELTLNASTLLSYAVCLLLLCTSLCEVHVFLLLSRFWIFISRVELQRKEQLKTSALLSDTGQVPPSRVFLLLDN